MTSTMSTLDKSHHIWHTPKIISTINDTTHTTPYLCSDNSILDPMLLSSDLEISQNQGIFGKRFGIPIRHKNKTWLSHPQNKNELLTTYSFTPYLCYHPSLIYDSDIIIDQILPCCITFKFQYSVMDILHQ